jgi:hypothetical protein
MGKGGGGKRGRKDPKQKSSQSHAESTTNRMLQKKVI